MKEDTFVELLLDEVLDGFDVVVGDLLDFLDATRLGKLELEVDGVQVREVEWRGHQSRLDHALVAEEFEPFDFDPDAVFDESEFGEVVL